MKTIKDAVIELGGKIPERTFHQRIPGSYYISTNCICLNGDVVCHIPDFVQQAKLMGYINGYRYGVEYPTNGKRPDLPDDGVFVWLDFKVKQIVNFGNYSHQITDEDWSMAKSFRIDDERYKPADTSYLDKHDSSLDSDAGWFDYDMHKAVSPAPIRTEVIVDCFDKGWKDAVVIGAFDRWNWLDINGGGLQTVDICRIKPLDHATRKAEAEKKRVVAAAQKECVNFSSNDLGRLYDAGLLRLPDQK